MSKSFPGAVLGLVLVLGVILMLLGGLWLYISAKCRSTVEVKERHFRRNSALLTKQVNMISCGRIFSSEELAKATNGYDIRRIVRTRRYSTVYKGILEEGTVVAVKRSKVADQAHIDLFIAELVILTQVNHRNVVKLLGCCLEMEVPTLVYEFVSNGSKLSKHIRGPASRISWRDRMRIAMETAEALAYLHSAATTPILHLDVNSSNILLDENYTAKVSDFGVSRRFINPEDQIEFHRLMQETRGYLDPMYGLTAKFTVKSDMYSFGVVLAELLTGMVPVSFERPREDVNLALYFRTSLERKELSEFIDKDVMTEGSTDEVRGVAELARRCLQPTEDERPASMEEVVRELQEIYMLHLIVIYP